MRRDYGYFEEDQLGKPYDLKLLRRLFPFVRPYRLLFLLSIFLVTGITALDLALPYLTKVVIDEYIVQDIGEERPEASQEKRVYVADLRRPETERVVNQYPAFFSIEWPYARYAGQGIMHDLRLSLFKHIQGLSLAFFTKNPVGRLVTRMTSDVQNMHEFFTSIITVLFKDVFLVLGITVVLLVMDWQLALICFLMLPFIFVATTYFSRLARDVFRELRVKIAEINTKLQETIDGIRIVQLFLQEKKNYKQFRHLNHENYLAGMRQINIFAVFMPAIEVLSSVTTALVIWYGGGRVVSEALSLGTLVAFISYMRMFFRPIRDIAEKYNIMQSAMASSERIFLLFDTREQIPEPDVPARMPGKGAIVNFENVWFSYVEGEWVLKDISLTVRHGETVAIVGPTGAGKSSLIHLLER
ncbi:MAG: ATP-binding cassette domain-containing protein, partial [Deltaproteobacteria bacterium]|nr:ATP-binding cassette domain-containing protein [Deltaproteobacteria bacterium]